MTPETMITAQVSQDRYNAALKHMTDWAIDTCSDIIRRSRKWGMTVKQIELIERLVIEAEGKASGVVAPAAQAVVDLSRINAMFELAAQNKKNPKVHFLAGDADFTVTPAKAGSANPGFLYVKSGGTYLGKIAPTGGFSPSREGRSLPVAEALHAFAKDPAAAAQAYGQSTGRCCFCAKGLEDPVSVMLGFGPQCAKSHGLRHSVAAAAEAAGDRLL